MKSSLSIFVLLVILLPGVTHGQDKSTYYTVMHPDEFTIDWNSWYEKWEQLTAEVRDEYPHHLDLAYGEDPKQKLDLYIPKDNPKDAPVFPLSSRWRNARGWTVRNTVTWRDRSSRTASWWPWPAIA